MHPIKLRGRGVRCVTLSPDPPFSLPTCHGNSPWFSWSAHVGEGKKLLICPSLSLCLSRNVRSNTSSACKQWWVAETARPKCGRSVSPLRYFCRIFISFNGDRNRACCYLALEDVVGHRPRKNVDLPSSNSWKNFISPVRLAN